MAEDKAWVLEDRCVQANVFAGAVVVWVKGLGPYVYRSSGVETAECMKPTTVVVVAVGDYCKVNL